MKPQSRNSHKVISVILVKETDWNLPSKSPRYSNLGLSCMNHGALDIVMLLIPESNTQSWLSVWKNKEKTHMER